MLIQLYKYVLSMLTVCILFTANASSTNEYTVELLNENNGFASSIIFSIVQDHNGFLWFGTAYDGVMRYDGKRVVRYLHDPNNKNSLAHNNAGNLTIDSNNNLWIGSWGGGLSRLNTQTHTFSHFQFDDTQTNSISDMTIKDIFEDQQGDIWVGTVYGGVNKFNHKQQDFSRLTYGYPLNPVDFKGTSTPRIWDIAQTKTAPDTLWIGTHNGLNRFNTLSNTSQNFTPPANSINPAQSKIRQILVTQDDALLLATDDGVLLFEPQTQTFTQLDIDGYPSIGPVYSMIKTSFNEYWITSNQGVFSFTDDSLTLKKINLGVDDQCSQTLFQGRQGIIWLSCEGLGVYKITKQDIFKVYNHPEVKSAYSLLATANDTLLIGTAENGMKQWDPITKQLTAINTTLDRATPPEIWGMAQTRQGEVWFLNSQSLFVVNKEGTARLISVADTFTHKDLFTHPKHMISDEQGNIWISTAHGLFVIRHTNTQVEYIPLGLSLKIKGATSLYRDAQNRIWVGSVDGLSVWDDSTKKAKHYRIATDQNLMASVSNFFYAIHQDRQKRLWVTTQSGLYLLDEKNAEFTLHSNVFIETENLGVRFIREDSLGYLWLFTPLGVSQFNPNNGSIQHFNKTNGLSATRYFTFDVAQISDGHIFFSSREGIHYFDPTTIKERQLTAKTLLTQFEILGNPHKEQITNQGSTDITLAYDQNYLKFEFATLDLLNARQIQYEYKLQGFDSDWIQNGANNSTVYTNLSGGDYLLKVRASTKNGLYYEEELQVKVSIATAIWLRWWMFVLYAALLFLGIVYYIQQQKKSVLKLEKQVAEKTAAIEFKSSKLEVANKVKTQFLANMSHEIRTPLTTVIGQAEAIICRDVNIDDIYKEVEVIHDSGLHLLELLNDILDLSKIEENKFDLELRSQDLHELLENIERMFSIQAKRKGLPFTLTKHLPSPFIVNIDNLRVKQILINLCSNAIKFTREGYVALDVLIEGNLLIFTITDTGIGMDTQQTRQAFDSFTQGDANISRRFGGTGLGLSLSRGLAELMNGNITVNSRLKEGSTFTFSIPVEILCSADAQDQKVSEHDVLEPETLFSGKILLAEDHNDNRRLIARLLTRLGLTVITAVDGLDAISQFLEHSPDVVFLDIQMPKMDGLEAYSILREKGCQQPIIALTANAMSHDVEQYLKLGFNGHLSKPLNRKNLIATIEKYFPSQIPTATDVANKALKSVDMSDLAIQFKATLAEEKEQFKLHANNQDIQSIAKQTHRLIGAAHLFGFYKLANITAQLETSIKANNLENVDSLLQNVYDEIAALTP